MALYSQIESNVGLVYHPLQVANTYCLIISDDLITLTNYVFNNLSWNSQVIYEICGLSSQVLNGPPHRTKGPGNRPEPPYYHNLACTHAHNSICLIIEIQVFQMKEINFQADVLEFLPHQVQLKIARHLVRIILL